MSYRYTVRNPTYLCSGDAASLAQAIAGVGLVVRTQGQFNPRQRFTWEIAEACGRSGDVAVRARGTMTYTQAGGH